MEEGKPNIWEYGDKYHPVDSELHICITIVISLTKFWILIAYSLFFWSIYEFISQSENIVNYLIWTILLAFLQKCSEVV